MADLFNLKFIRYLGLSCLFVSAGFVFISFQLLKIAADMYSLLFLLFAVYHFLKKPVGAFWLRYSFILLLLTIVIAQYELPDSAQYQLPDNVILLPIAAYQIIVTAALCYAVVLSRSVHVWEKWALLIAFLCLGMLKSVSPFNSGMLYPYEIMLSLLVNFYIMFLFITRIYHSVLNEKNSFRILGDNTSDIIFNYMLKPEPYFSYVSPAVEAMTGYKQKEFYNNPDIFKELTVKNDRQLYSDLFNSHEQISQIMRWQKKNGEFFWVEFHNSPVYDGETLISVEGVIRDITEWKRAEEEMLQSKKASQMLFSYISHELKTPVTSILGYAKALEFNVIEDPQKRKEAFALIISKSLRLQRIIEDLIQLSKLESNQFSFQFTEIPVIQFFEFIIKKQKTVIESGGFHFHSSISRKTIPESYSFIADVERMEQVFDNLINNAMKFTPQNGAIRISCDLDHLRKNVVFEVRDTGAGIPAKCLPFVFDAYYISKSTIGSNPEGIGLGLSITKEIIKGHKGDIFVESKVGKGSCFIIVMPLYIF